MAEVLFADYQAATSGSSSDAAAPLDSDDLDLTSERATAVLQVDEDLVAGPNENRAEQPKSRTLVF